MVVITRPMSLGLTASGCTSMAVMRRLEATLMVLSCVPPVSNLVTEVAEVT